MKSLSLFVSAAALLSASSVFAADINCAIPPTCESLGYTDDISYCPADSNGIVHAVRCPFNTSKATCIHEAAVGQIAYFTKAPGRGWLLCNGQIISKANYPDLYKFLGQQFCNTNHGGTCGNDVGRVPNYQGYFLRVSGQPSSEYGKVGNSTLVNPQKEGLPNITGKGIPSEAKSVLDGYLTKTYGTTGFFEISGALVKDCNNNGKNSFGGIGDNDSDNCRVNFDASVSNSIYGSSTGVTPPNYAVYAYIYAGRVAPAAPHWVCDTCGYTHEGNSAPTKCPLCGVSSSHFNKN